MAWFDPESGELTKPLFRLAWVMVLSPCLFVSTYVSAVSQFTIAVPVALGIAIAATIVGCVLLSRLRGVTHLLAWAAIGGFTVSVLKGGVVDQFVPPEQVKVVLITGRAYLACLCVIMIVQVGWYLWGRYYGRPLPIRFDSWLGASVKPRPRPDQVVAYIVYPLTRSYMNISGEEYDAYKGIPIHAGLARLPEDASFPNELPNAIPAKWLTAIALNKVPHVRVFSLIAAPLVRAIDVPTRDIRSLLGDSFNGFLCISAGKSTASADSIPIQGGRLRLGLRVTVPEPSGRLTVSVAGKVVDSNYVLQVDRLALGHGTLLPAAPWISSVAEQRPLNFQTTSAADVAISLRLASQVPDPGTLAELCLGLLSHDGPPLVELNVLVGSGDQSGGRLRVSRDNGSICRWAEIPAVADNWIPFVTECHRWLVRGGILPDDIQLDAGSGRLVGASAYSGFALTAVGQMYYVSQSDTKAATMIPSRMLSALVVARGLSDLLRDLHSPQANPL